MNRNHDSGGFTGESDRAAPPVLPPSRWSEIGVSLHLSPRELEVVRSVFECGQDSGIAVRLGISPHTVHTYLDRIYRKLGVNSRCDLVLRIFREYIALEHQPGRPHFDPGVASDLIAFGE